MYNDKDDYRPGMNISQSDSKSPLLFFDTGMGGLSVLSESQKLLPTAPIVYAADYAGLPYGMKSEQELASRVPALLGRLVERYRPQLVTIACNTASTITLDYVRSALDIPVVGTVPAVKPASEMTTSGVIGLLGTEATIRQPYVDRLANEYASDKKLIRYGAPDLVFAAEAKLRGEKLNLETIKSAVGGLLDQAGGSEIDVIILACTHFPLLQDELQKAVGNGIKFVDGSSGIARRIKYLTRSIVWPERQNSGVFVTSSDLSGIEAYKSVLANYGINEFEEL